MTFCSYTVVFNNYTFLKENCTGTSQNLFLIFSFKIDITIPGLTTGPESKLGQNPESGYKINVGTVFGSKF